LLGAQGKKAPESHQAESGLEQVWNSERAPLHQPSLALQLAAELALRPPTKVRGSDVEARLASGGRS
jgi:hypothetical protein